MTVRLRAVRTYGGRPWHAVREGDPDEVPVPLPDPDPVEYALGDLPGAERLRSDIPVVAFKRRQDLARACELAGAVLLPGTAPRRG